MSDPISIGSSAVSIVSTTSNVVIKILLKFINRPIIININKAGKIYGNDKKISKIFNVLSRDSKYLQRLCIRSIDDRKELKHINDIYKESRRIEIQNIEQNLKNGIILVLSPEAKNMYQVNIDMDKYYLKIIKKFIKLYMRIPLPYTKKDDQVTIDCIQENGQFELVISVDVPEKNIIESIKTFGISGKPIVDEGLIYYGLCIHDIRNSIWLYKDFFPNMLYGVISHISNEEYSKLNIAKLYDTFDWSIGLH